MRVLLLPAPLGLKHIIYVDPFLEPINFRLWDGLLSAPMIPLLIHYGVWMRLEIRIKMCKKLFWMRHQNLRKPSLSKSLEERRLSLNLTFDGANDSSKSIPDPFPVCRSHYFDGASTSNAPNSSILRISPRASGSGRRACHSSLT